MTFPQRNWFGITKDWKDLGIIGYSYSIENGVTVKTTKVCSNCNGRLRIGKEMGNIFRYCPLCEVKIVGDEE